VTRSWPSARGGLAAAADTLDYTLERGARICYAASAVFIGRILGDAVELGIIPRSRRGEAMTTMLAYPHIQKSEGCPAHLQRVPRVRVAQIAMDYLAHGWSAEEMCRQHLNLLPAEAHVALAYYFDHQDEIDAEIREEWEGAESDRRTAQPSPFFLRLRAKGLL
jgi:hypothetical protein